MGVGGDIYSKWGRSSSPHSSKSSRHHLTDLAFWHCLAGFIHCWGLAERIDKILTASEPQQSRWARRAVLGWVAETTAQLCRLGQCSWAWKWFILNAAQIMSHLLNLWDTRLNFEPHFWFSGITVILGSETEGRQLRSLQKQGQELLYGPVSETLGWEADFMCLVSFDTS